MAIHQRINLTPFAVDLGLCQDAEGRDVAVALLKATFCFTPAGKVSPAEGEALLPVFPFDLHWGKPDDSSLRYAGDVVPEKRGTDVAVNGHVYGRKSKAVEAGFKVGNLRKILQVVGPRRWVKVGASWSIAGPEAFEKVPLRYEHAFGGAAFPQNPIGAGYAPPQDGAPCPSLHLPGELYSGAKDRPAPASLGFLPPGWRQRSRFAGTFDAAWERERRPLFPADFDPRFYNAVPEDQVLMPKLAGGEKVTLLNLHPAAPQVSFEVPRRRFVADFLVKGEERSVPMETDTLLIEPDEGRFGIAYRASILPGEALRLLSWVRFREVRVAEAPRRVDKPAPHGAQSARSPGRTS